MFFFTLKISTKISFHLQKRVVPKYAPVYLFVFLYMLTAFVFVTHYLQNQLLVTYLVDDEDVLIMTRTTSSCLMCFVSR